MAPCLPAALLGALVTLLLPAVLRAQSQAPAEDPPSEASGQISWVDPQAGAFGIETEEEELEFTVGPDTAIQRDGKAISLEQVQPGDWAVSCLWRLSGEKRLCLRLEIQTPPEEEGLE